MVKYRGIRGIGALIYNTVNHFFAPALTGYSAATPASPTSQGSSSTPTLPAAALAIPPTRTMLTAAVGGPTPTRHVPGGMADRAPSVLVVWGER